MLTLDTLEVKSYDIDELTVQWEFEPTSESMSDYELDVYRSENPGVSGLSGYDIIASGISLDSNTLYTDSSIEGLYDTNRTWYYKIDIINTTNSNNKVAPEEPAYIRANPPDYRSKYIIKWKKRVLNGYSGQTLYLLKRRTWGERCEDHWDDTLQRVTGDDPANCDCYGTGWKGGYFDPIEFKGMINPSPEVDEISMFGEFKPSDALLNMLPFPPVRASDIIVDGQERFIVLQQRPVERLGVPIEQKVQVSLVHPDDVTYQIPLNI